MNRLCFLFFMIAPLALFAQTDTILVHSAVMNKEIKCVVIRPSGLGRSDASPSSVVFLLNGWAGNYAQWPGLAPQLKDRADALNLLLICPDGGFDSWYFDSPIDSSVRYETFLIKELMPYVDAHYRTMADRRHRAITGLSMGGHGGLYLGIRHRDLFGAAGAISGGVDFRPFPDNWGLKKDLGSMAEHKENWDKNTVVNIIDDLRNGELKLIFDCGVDDFFLPVNRQLHQKLLEKKIDHDYSERPGGHTAAYWKNSIDYQLLFFWKYFNGF